jgi:isoamylase
VPFTLPVTAGDAEWSLLIDTNSPSSEDGARFKAGATYDVTARSMLVFARSAKHG